MNSLSPNKSSLNERDTHKHLEKQEVVFNSQLQSPFLPKFTTSNSQWDQFEQFRKRIHDEKQHFKDRVASPRKDSESYQMLDKVQSNNLSASDIRFKNENIELKERLIKLQLELDSRNIQQPDQQSQYQKQLKQVRETYEKENKELLDRLNCFTDELEELKSVYKEKNMKLYNMVIGLEQEKQELIDKNIQLIDQRQTSNKQDNYGQFFEQIKELKNQILNLDFRHTKLKKEKDDLQVSHNHLLSQQSDSINKKTQSTDNEEHVIHHFKQRQTAPISDYPKPPLSEKINENNRSSRSLHIDDINNSAKKQSSSKKKQIKNQDSPPQAIKKHQIDSGKDKIKKLTAKKQVGMPDSNSFLQQSQKKLTVQEERNKTPKQKTKSVMRPSTALTLDRTSITTQSVKQFSALDSAKKSVVNVQNNSVKKPKTKLKKKSQIKSEKIQVFSK